MLDALRKSIGSWVAKIFIGLLVLSFAVWGVSDIFTGYRGTEIARVGETEVPAEVFRDSLQREIQAVSQQMGSYLSLDEARAIGLDQRVLSRLTTEAALDEEARRRGLGLTESVVADSIRADPAFRAPGGQFDRAYFQQFLQATGYSESGFVEEQRRRLLRHVIGESIAGQPTPPQTLAAAIDRYRNEARSAEYLLISADAFDDVPEPGEDELRQYFEENIADFRAPEYRRVALIGLEPEDVAETIEVSDEDARALYESRTGEFERDERRTIEQVAFDTVEAAAEARERIDDGASFEEIAEEQGVTDGDRMLGSLTREEVVDPVVAEAAFRLDEGAVSDPLDGMFSPVLVRVSDVEEGEAQPFEEVEDEMRRELALDRARGEILDLYDAIEDGRAAGMTLAEVAEQQQVSYREIEAIDSRGRDPDGEPVPDIPQAQEVLQGAFDTDIGIEVDPIQLGAEGYLWFEVLEITPGRERGFEEAEADARAAWRDQELSARIDERARAIAEQWRNGTDIGELAEEIEAEADTVGPLTRADTSGPFGRAATGMLFTTPAEEIGVAVAEGGSDRVVFRVTERTIPDYTPSEDDPYAGELASGLTEDMIGQYIAQLQNRLGVTINQQALRQALGETEDDF